MESLVGRTVSRSNSLSLLDNFSGFKQSVTSQLGSDLLLQHQAWVYCCADGEIHTQMIKDWYLWIGEDIICWGTSNDELCDNLADSRYLWQLPGSEMQRGCSGSKEIWDSLQFKRGGSLPHRHGCVGSQKCASQSNGGGRPLFVWDLVASCC